MIRENCIKRVLVALAAAFLTGSFGIFSASASAGEVYKSKGDATLEVDGARRVFKSNTHQLTLGGGASIWIFDLNEGNAGNDSNTELLLLMANQSQKTMGYVAWHKTVTNGSITAYRDNVITTLAGNSKVEIIAHRPSTPTRSVVDLRLNGNRTMLVFLFSNGRYYNLLITSEEDWSTVGAQVEDVVASFNQLK